MSEEDHEIDVDSDVPEVGGETTAGDNGQGVSVVFIVYCFKSVMRNKPHVGVVCHLCGRGVRCQLSFYDAVIV